MTDLSMADNIHTAKKQNQKPPIHYYLLCIFNSQDRTKVFALVLHTNQIW